MDAVEVILAQQGIKELRFPVTESLCQPGTSYDVSCWLTTRGYRATSLIKGTGLYCGMKEDEIGFRKSLEEINKHGASTKL